MGGDLGEVHDGRLHQLVIEVAAAPVFGQVAFRPLQQAQEVLLERLAEEAFAKLERTASVAQHLDGLDPRQVVEEPAAARGHEQGMALQLQELERAHPFLSLGLPAVSGVALEESGNAFG